MKVKVSELKGVALDYAVALAEEEAEFWTTDNYSTQWVLGGPIIEREGIALDQARSGGKIESWIAARVEGPAVSEAYGPTPLIAAMRCYVASHLGDEIEVPNELTGE